jgi:hypothetical protein
LAGSEAVGGPADAGGAPLAPGTGNAFALGNPCPGGRPFGLTLAGIAPGALRLAAGLTDALGGTGNLPCWISDARCETAGGRPGPGEPARAAAAAVGEPGVAAGWLITVLMIAVLWMLLNTMLFCGGAIRSDDLTKTGIGTNTGRGRMNSPTVAIGGANTMKSGGGGGRKYTGGGGGGAKPKSGSPKARKGRSI